MKIFVHFLLIFTVHYAKTFEYHDVESVEEFKDRYFDDYYKELRDEILNNDYNELLKKQTTTENTENIPSNELPVESYIKPDESYLSSIPEVNTEENSVPHDEPKPFYNLDEAPELFRKFIMEYDKQYKDADDYNKHFENFVNSLKDINKLNKEEDATFDINMFADLGDEESITG